MKHIKTYKNINQPEIGDYIIAKLPEFEELDEFLLNNIGVIDYIYKDNKSYDVIYKKVPRKFRHFFSYDDDINIKNLINYSIEIHVDYILHSSKNINDLQIYIDTNKYNL